MFTTPKVVWIMLVILLIPQPASGYSIKVSITTTDGLIVPMSNYENTPLLVDAFATWCLPCRTEILHLKDVYDVVGDKVNILSLSISPESDSIQDIISFQNEFEAPWDFGLDHNSEFLDKFNVNIIPTLYLFDANGNLLDQWGGITDSNKIIESIELNFNLSLSEVENKDLTIFSGELIKNNLFQITASLFGISFVYLLLVPSVKPK